MPGGPMQTDYDAYGESSGMGTAPAAGTYGTTSKPRTNSYREQTLARAAIAPKPGPVIGTWDPELAAYLAGDGAI